MVAMLTGIFGTEHLGLAEDVVQETLARAVQTWPYYGVPKNPAGWIMQAAKNLALDAIRREKNFRSKEEQIISFLEQGFVEEQVNSLDNEIHDERLRLIFVCCHPVVPHDTQVALALRTLCGFSNAEIAKAFLTTEVAMAKKLTRAKQTIRDAKVAFEIPVGPALSQRLDAVLQTLYLLFNEGYRASTGTKLVRNDLCDEAIRLAQLIVEHAACNQPRTHALLSLMLLNAARFATRVDGEGNILRLGEQDRTQWDKRMIARGLFHLAQSASGNDVSAYHLQAGIAASHCAAPDYRSTDWANILALYNQLVCIDDSPVVALNRAVAVAKVHGPRAGIAAVEAIRQLKKLESYSLLYAVLGEFESQLNNLSIAAAHFQRAAQLTEIPSERTFLLQRFRACASPACLRASSHERQRQPSSR
jgi:RNA polymerase sigma-70 factor (ECF subfamily)